MQKLPRTYRAQGGTTLQIKMYYIVMIHTERITQMSCVEADITDYNVCYNFMFTNAHVRDTTSLKFKNFDFFCISR